MSAIKEMIKSYRTNSKKGSALLYVFVIIIVLSVLTMTILSILASNTKQAQYQEDSMETYYLAYSGVQMAYSALLANSNAKMTELTRATNPLRSKGRQTSFTEMAKSRLSQNCRPIPAMRVGSSLRRLRL